MNYYNFSIKRWRLVFAVALGFAALAGSGFAQNPRPFPSTSTSASASDERVKSKSNITNNREANLSSGDKSFMKEAAKGGMMEVAMGRVAEKNASDAEVKKFGARMVSDHGKANDELKSLAKEKTVELPGESEAGKWKSDKDYMEMMVKDHEKDLAEFEKQAKNGSDADVKAFADKTAKIVRKHLEMAKEINGKLK